MKSRTLAIVLCLTGLMKGEEDRSIEMTLFNLANIVIPQVHFSDGTSVEDAVDYLNLVLRAPDPPPPKRWKIRLEVSELAAKTKLSLDGKNLNLHQVLGHIADAMGAELVVTREGIILRDPTGNGKQQESPDDP